MSACCVWARLSEERAGKSLRRSWGRGWTRGRGWAAAAHTAGGIGYEPVQLVAEGHLAEGGKSLSADIHFNVSNNSCGRIYI